MDAVLQPVRVEFGVDYEFASLKVHLTGSRMDINQNDPDMEGLGT